MKTAVAFIAALSAAGCEKPALVCWPTDNVRAIVDGRQYLVLVDLKPTFIGESVKDAPLPSFSHRDGKGEWAYCQSERDPPVQAEHFSIHPQMDLPEVSFIQVGRNRRFERWQPRNWPRHDEAGFEVTTMEKQKLIFSPAGGVRSTPVDARCSPTLDSEGFCRVDFITRKGVNVSFDVSEARPLTEWPNIIDQVETYVSALET